MSRTLLALALLLLAALGLAAWSTRGGRDLRVDRAAGPGPIRAGAGGEPVLAEGSDAAPGIAAQEATAVARVPAAQAEPTAPLEPDVAGVLTTAAGRPVADALVRIEWKAKSLPVRSGFLDDAYARMVRTDARGTFLFEGVSRTNGGDLVYGWDLVLGTPIRQRVDPAADWQILRLPEFAPQPALARIDVVTEAGRPLPIEAVELEFRGPTPSVLARRPTAADRVVESGRVTLHGLIPGKWFVWVVVDGGGEGGLEFEIERPDREAGLTMVLPWFEGAVDSTVTASAPPGEKLWIDPSTGILGWLPEATLALGEEDSDRYFATTLRLGHGPVSAATLTLRVRSINGMSSNDAIYLEHVGQRDFRWRGALADLVPGKWPRGDAATLRLHLSALPTPEGSFDLLPYLEDGLLDVILQDDTAVDSVSLRVVR